MGLQLYWTLDIQGTLQKHLGTLQVVSFLGFSAFSAQENTCNVFHAPIHTL